MSSSSSDSDDSLPSLSDIKLWSTSKARLSPTKPVHRVSRWNEAIEDPAETAIQASSRKKDRSGSEQTKDAGKTKKVSVKDYSQRSMLAPLSGSSSGQPRELPASGSKHKPRGESASQAQDPKEEHRAVTLASAAPSPMCDCATRSRECSTVPETDEDDKDASLMSGTKALSSPASKAMSIQMMEMSITPSTTPEERANEDELARLLFPEILQMPIIPKPDTLPSPPRLVNENASRKARRITIIEIPSDSEDEQPLAASSITPSSLLTPALLPFPRSQTREEQHSPDEVSFADYSSDDDAPSVAATAPTGKAAERTVLDIDSSDSEYDRAAGVITWAPTPNKTRKLQTSPRKPLQVTKRPLASYLNVPHTPTARKSSNSSSGSSDREDPLAPMTPSTSKAKKVFAPTSSSPAIVYKEPSTALRKDTGKAKTATKSPTKARTARSFKHDRDTFAQQLIQELDEKVFEGRLPQDLKIVWNGRLNTTAGRASWKKTTTSTGEKAFQSSIELATKVIDCEEKLRNTLSHELCHIAAWAIDKEMKPAHGPAFKHWGRRIMKARKDISVTTRHTYEIAYKFQWQCTNSSCAKVYGRHSKSIDPTKHACGVCASRLVQLDKDGNPVDRESSTPRKESEWQIFSKAAFKRMKADNPGSSMTQINQKVAAEWQEIKLTKATWKTSSLASSLTLIDDLGNLQL